MLMPRDEGLFSVGRLHPIVLFRIRNRGPMNLPRAFLDLPSDSQKSALRGQRALGQEDTSRQLQFPILEN
eukprot:3380555-Amphidinium_carterae.1